MMERSSMVWVVDYLMNSAWQVPLVFLVAFLTGRLVSRLYSVVALHWTWVGALALATVLPACRFHIGLSVPWWHAAAIAGGRVQVTILPGAAAAGNLRLSAMMMATLLTLYVVVIMYFAGRIVWGLLRTGMLRRNASASVVAEPLRLRWEALCMRFGVTQAALCVSPAVPGPAVVGLRTVLLPSEFIGKVAESDLDAALAHELAHLRRGDFFKNVAYAVLMLPVAYHPCAWLLQKAVAESRETVCDAMAAEALDGKRNYARSLLRLAMAIPAGLHGRATAAVGVFEGNTLERRVRIMMDRGKQLRGAARLAAMAAVLILTGGAVVSMMGTHLTVQAADTTAGKTPVLHVPAGKMVERIQKQVMPKYPAEARAKHNTLNGACVLGVTINKEGVPTDIHVVKSLRKDYDESALTAVRQWRWKPVRLNGKPVAVETKVTLTYKIY